MKRGNSDYIGDTLESIEEFVKGMDCDDFLRDVKIQYTVIRVLEIIGGAVKNISEDLKSKFSWKAIAGIRDKLTHLEVDWEVVWLTIKKDIPKIKFEDTLEGGV